MTWVYKVKEAAFYLDGTYKFDALYAGSVGYYNDPAQQCEKNKGPLPAGKYTIGNPFQHKTAGKYVLRLTAASSNNMCGRDGFLIHGDSIKEPGTASNGCIITSLTNRIAIHASKDTNLIVE